MSHAHVSAGRIEVTYNEVDDGAELVYRTADPVLVGAIHAWFEAQTTDHGGHAG